MAYIATFVLDDFYNHSELNQFSSVKYVSWGAVTFVLGWLVLGVAGLFDEDVNRFFFFSASCACDPSCVLFCTWLISAPGEFFSADCF